jgi:hypothetical protein
MKMRASLALLPAAVAAVLAASPGPASAAPRANGKAAKAAKAVKAARAVRGKKGNVVPAAVSAPAHAAVAPATDEPVHHGAGFGAVVHVTPIRVYLDAGSAEGLAVGQPLRLFRGGAVVGTCDVETVAPHHATCRTDDAARRGDLVRVSPPPAPPAPKPLPRLVAADELDRRAAAVAEQPVPKIESKVKEQPVAVVAARRFEVSAEHAVWASSGARPFNEERVDATIRGAEAFAGMRLYADLRAVHRTTRPADFRTRPVDRSQIYVYEANLASRDPSRPYTIALGRVLPFALPGATSFDGAQLGITRWGGEVGVFGGLVPNPSTTAPNTERSTGGVYAAFDHGQGWLVGREELRAAAVTSPELGTRLEAEVRSLLLVARRVNLEGDLRVGVGGQHQAQNAIDLAQVDVSGRPFPKLQLSGLFRYSGLSVPDAPAPALFPGPERRWDGNAGYEVGPAVVSAAGGQGRDLSSGLERWWAGPELGFPRLFGNAGGVSLGYAEERGWLAGRTAWAQAAIRAGARARLNLRLSWTMDERTGGFDDHALGLYGAMSADVTSWLAIRGSVLARVGARGLDLQDPAQGITALVSLVSRF